MARLGASRRSSSPCGRALGFPRRHWLLTSPSTGSSPAPGGGPCSPSKDGSSPTRSPCGWTRLRCPQSTSFSIDLALGHGDGAHDVADLDGLGDVEPVDHIAEEVVALGQLLTAVVDADEELRA